MGTSYKALLRAFVITSPTFHPPIAVSLVGNLAAALRGFYVFSQGVRYCFHALFIGFGLIGKGIHTCRRTFEFNDFRSSATLLVR